MSAADAFSLRGGPMEVADRLTEVLRAAPAKFDYVVLHPIPNPPTPDDPDRGYLARMAREVLRACERPWARRDAEVSRERHLT